MQLIRAIICVLTFSVSACTSIATEVCGRLESIETVYSPGFMQKKRWMLIFEVYAGRGTDQLCKKGDRITLFTHSVVRDLAPIQKNWQEKIGKIYIIQYKEDFSPIYKGGFRLREIRNIEEFMADQKGRVEEGR